jgi:hypothetical protein
MTNGKNASPLEKSNAQAATIPAKDNQDAVALFQEKKALTITADKMKEVRKLTMDATSLPRLGQVICQTLSELYEVPMPSMADKAATTMTPVIDILDVVSGQAYLLICNALVKSAFVRAGAPLAGRYFAMRAGDIVAGKRYRKCDVWELERVE